MMKDIISLNRFNEITSKFSSIDPIVVVGDVGIDKYTFGEVRRISPEAPVPVLEVTKEWLKLGLAANISHNLRTLGVKSTLCGVVGEDNNANLFDNLLEDEKLNTWGIVRTKSRPTIFKERVTTDTQQICRIDYESSEYIDEETEQKILLRINEFVKTHQALIIEDYAKGTLTKSLIASLITKFKSNGKLVAVDPGRSTPPLYYKGATLLKPNLKEAKIMVESLGYKEKKLENIAKILIDKLDLQMLVITLGAEGMALLDIKTQPELKIIPTVANEVFDVSGAGDTAISVLTSALLAGATLEEAAWIGNCASGVVVGKKGTATVNLEELNSFFQKLVKKINH
ncbi:MAG: bifunctional hydroxymethylpyrimidine kinase/phosphomethylpyrimidine kinase [Bacteriovorax sp.]|nr:bifunctional hydroxymethylpyrimidine kinase/phosphomethylpyrimidine kinase [Bacteriovorax sp.]